jgi:hypothetical protein
VVVAFTSFSTIEGPEGVKWELGLALFLTGKMGLDALGLGFTNKRTIENGNGIENLTKTDGIM